jgi:hypothetical protein
MEEQSKEFFGTVFVLPESRRFELATTIRGAHVTLSGTISQHLAEQFAGHPEAGRPIDPGQVSIRPRRVEILTRDIHERNRATRKVHFLMRLVDEDEQGADKPVSPAA